MPPETPSLHEAEDPTAAPPQPETSASHESKDLSTSLSDASAESEKKGSDEENSSDPTLPAVSDEKGE